MYAEFGGYSLALCVPPNTTRSVSPLLHCIVKGSVWPRKGSTFRGFFSASQREFSLSPFCLISHYSHKLATTVSPEKPAFSVQLHVEVSSLLVSQLLCATGYASFPVPICVTKSTVPWVKYTGFPQGRRGTCFPTGPFQCSYQQTLNGNTHWNSWLLPLWLQEVV